MLSVILHVISVNLRIEPRTANRTVGEQNCVEPTKFPKANRTEQKRTDLNSTRNELELMT